MLKNIILFILSKEFIFLSKQVAKIEIIAEIDKVLPVIFRLAPGN
jgi:hypothetical protein